MELKMAECVYVLTNEAMPGLVKIGMAVGQSVEDRMRNLFSTSIALPFECYYAAEVGDARFVESSLHKAFAHVRVHPNREFFRISPEQVMAALRIGAIREVTPGKDIIVEGIEDLEALDKARSRQKNFNFANVEIPVGAELSFSRNIDIKCRVVSDNKVEFENQTYSVSALALKILQEQYHWTAKTVNGRQFWMYNDETLSARAEYYRDAMNA